MKVLAPSPIGWAVVIGLAAICSASAAAAQAHPGEPTDIHIRRLAGLPPASAVGQIEIIDIGHDPLSTMLSIVGNRTSKGWQISYACAGSPHCARGADHLAKSYLLSASDSAEVDCILDQLRQGGEPDGQAPAPGIIGGQLLVRIDFHGFRRDYRRVISWGQILGRLEAVMSAPAK